MRTDGARKEVIVMEYDIPEGCSEEFRRHRIFYAKFNRWYKIYMITMLSTAAFFHFLHFLKWWLL